MANNYTGITRNRSIKYRLKFSRANSLRYLSHLDQIKMLRRVIRRAELPVSYTEGFHPQIRASFGPAISVGYESESEYVDIELTRELDYREMHGLINAQLPADFRLVEIRKIMLITPALEAYANQAKYLIRLPADLLDAFSGKMETALEEFLARKTIPLDKTRKGVVKTVDARPLIYGMKFDGRDAIELDLGFGPGANVKAEKVVAALLGIDEERMLTLSVKRVELYSREKNGSVVKL